MCYEETRNSILTYNIICCIVLVTGYYITYNIKQEKILYFELMYLRRDKMVFNTGAALLDAVVLAVVSREEEGTYGYKITQDVREVLEVSESTLYPVLRRLKKDGCLEVYDKQYGGRNRRYYKITSVGIAQLSLYKEEWKQYSQRISGIFEGGERV